MVKNTQQSFNLEEINPPFRLTSFLLVIVAAQLGAFAAIKLLPLWIPGLSASIVGADPKAFWYLARGSAFTAYILLWLSMLLGVGITNKLASLWPGLPPTIDLHQFTSVVGLAFGMFHALILLGDHYIGFKLAQIFLPFSTISYKPLTVGIGQLGMYLWVILIISFYVRKQISKKVWRFIHYSSFIMFLAALVHGIFSGTDTSSLWAQAIYWSTGSILAVMVAYRIFYAISGKGFSRR